METGLIPDVFETPRLRGERLTAAHLPDVRRIHQNAAMMALLGGVRDASESGDYMERNLAHWDKYGFGLWVLREPASGGVAGLSCLRHLQIGDQDEIEIGYSLFPPLWGRGLATEIAAKCADLGLRVLGWPSVVALTRPENHASQRVLIKTGLEWERNMVHSGETHLLFRRVGTRGAPP